MDLGHDSTTKLQILLGDELESEVNEVGRESCDKLTSEELYNEASPTQTNLLEDSYLKQSEEDRTS